jgi:hypothetical protein
MIYTETFSNAKSILGYLGDWVLHERINCIACTASILPVHPHDDCAPAVRLRTAKPGCGLIRRNDLRRVSIKLCGDLRSRLRCQPGCLSNLQL